MRARNVMIGCAALAIACLSQSNASAGRRNRSEQPVDRTTTTILPSREELAAVPVPQQGRVMGYPVDVVRYGLTVHPGARLARRVMGR